MLDNMQLLSSRFERHNINMTNKFAIHSRHKMFIKYTPNKKKTATCTVMDVALGDSPRYVELVSVLIMT